VLYNNRSEVVSGCVWDVWKDATNASGLPGTFEQASGPGYGDVDVCQSFTAGVSALVSDSRLLYTANDGTRNRRLQSNTGRRRRHSRAR
jgi:hypothetical protein